MCECREKEIVEMLCQAHLRTQMRSCSLHSRIKQSINLPINRTLIYSNRQQFVNRRIHIQATNPSVNHSTIHRTSLSATGSSRLIFAQFSTDPQKSSLSDQSINQSIRHEIHDPDDVSKSYSRDRIHQTGIRKAYPTYEQFTRFPTHRPITPIRSMYLRLQQILHSIYQSVKQFILPSKSAEPVDPSQPVDQSVISLESQNRTLRFAFLGNISIAALKLLVFLLTSSQAMFAEFVHTMIDSLNQGLLLVGAQQAMRQPDHRHQSGYGKAPYFFSLVSALNIFWIGVVFNSVHALSHAPMDMTTHWYTWAVLGMSFAIDGAVLKVALTEMNRTRPAGRKVWKHWKNMKNPLIIGTIMEDVAAVTGVVIAGAGIGLAQVTGNVMYDHIASLSISGLLLYTSYMLIRTNYSYLLGYSVSPAVQASITNMIAARPSIESVYHVRGEWMSSEQFAFRCEIDFDGSYFSAMLEESYREAFRIAVEKDKQEEVDANRPDRLNDPATSMNIEQPAMTLSNNEAVYRFAPQFMTYPAIPAQPARHLSKLLAEFAEDVTRLVEEEVVSIEQEIRAAHPQAAFIELEPASNSSLRSSSTVFNRRVKKDVKVDDGRQ